MAVSQQFASPFVIASNDTFELGDVSPGLVGTMPIQFENLGSFNGSLQLVSKIGTGPYLPHPYRRVNVGGVASDDTFVATAIIDSGSIDVDASGRLIALICTGWTTGSIRVHSRKLDG